MSISQRGDYTLYISTPLYYLLRTPFIICTIYLCHNTCQPGIRPDQIRCSQLMLPLDSSYSLSLIRTHHIHINCFGSLLETPYSSCLFLLPSLTLCPAVPLCQALIDPQYLPQYPGRPRPPQRKYPGHLHHSRLTPHLQALTLIISETREVTTTNRCVVWPKARAGNEISEFPRVSICRTLQSPPCHFIPGPHPDSTSHPARCRPQAT